MKHLLKFLFGKKKPKQKEYFFEVVETEEEKQERLKQKYLKK
nr:MAG TPA: hypothetical protein [Caudoviricetes sp.]